MNFKSLTRRAALFSIVILLTGCNSDNVITPDEPNPDPTAPGSFRPASASSSAEVTDVFEWTPAPGQFINDPTGGVEWPASLTAEQAASRALENLKKHYTVSLGSFGGYIVTGFDHSVPNNGGYEIGILGNAFISASGNSNEPGIVYVMQDTNGNGKPDDTWYELKGSDTFVSSTIRDYSVTYYRPEADGQPVRWTDNKGGSGEVPYVSAFHKQPTYYPVWVKEASYTLSGTCLEARTFFDESNGYWSNPPFDWGYADNLGGDNTEYAGIKNCSRFRISDAIDKEGNPVTLPYIDFVKVQTGVMSSAGWLGEVSTEVGGIIDLTLKR